MSDTDTQPDAPILFYDGECGFCARSVQWALDHDREQVLRFAPLQGSTYAGLDAAGKPDDLSTLVLRDRDGLHVRSDGVLRLLRITGGGWSVLGAVARIIPRFVRDAMYRFIAKHRSALGSADSCRLPTADTRDRFLP